VNFQAMGASHLRVRRRPERRFLRASLLTGLIFVVCLLIALAATQL